MKKAKVIVAIILVLFEIIVTLWCLQDSNFKFGGAFTVCNVLFVASFLYFFIKDMSSPFYNAAQSAMYLFLHWSWLILLYNARLAQETLIVAFIVVLVCSFFYLGYIITNVLTYYLERKRKRDRRRLINQSMLRWIDARNILWGLPPEELEKIKSQYR